MWSDKQLSVLIIVIDALRADCAPGAVESPHLRAVGLKPPALPACSGLVQGSTAFSQAIACASYTTAAHASLFTGLTPPEHGVRGFKATSLSRDAATLAEILAGNGYATCMMSDQLSLFQLSGLDRGFQVTVGLQSDALAWWDSYAGQPRFLFVHLWDVHRPYGVPMVASQASRTLLQEEWEQRLRKNHIPLPPAPKDRQDHDPAREYLLQLQLAWHNARDYKTSLADYIDGVRVFDQERLAAFGAALRAHQMLDGSIVCLTADHGEGRDLSPSPLTLHTSSLVDDQIRIPLYLRLPGRPLPARIDDQVSQVDIAPTLLEVLGLLDQRTPAGAPCGGRSLLPLWHNQPLPERPAYAEISDMGRAEATADTDLTANREATLRYRALRYAERKYWLVGKPGALDAAALAAPAEELVETFFRDLLGRRPSGEMYETWLRRVQAVPGSDLAGRRRLAQQFEHSGEFQRLPKYAVYDLQRDPLELKPRDPRLKPADWADYQEQLDLMLALDAAARPGEPLISNESDEEVILKRLQGLGYVE